MVPLIQNASTPRRSAEKTNSPGNFFVKYRPPAPSAVLSTILPSWYCRK